MPLLEDKGFNVFDMIEEGGCLGNKIFLKFNLFQQFITIYPLSFLKLGIEII